MQGPDILKALEAIFVRTGRDFVDPAVPVILDEEPHSVPGRQDMSGNAQLDNVRSDNNYRDVLAALSRMADLSKNSGQDIIKEIGIFLSAVIRLAGLDPGRSGELGPDDPLKHGPKVMDFLSPVDPGDAEPGDLIVYTASGERNVGLVESCDPENKKATVYGFSESGDDLVSMDIPDFGARDGVSCLRPLLSLFMVHVAGPDNNEGHPEDYDEYVSNSRYPSPSP